MSFLSWDAKDPDEILSYSLDWTARLAGDTISTSVWTVPAPLTASAQANTTTAASLKLAGGVAGTTYEVHNRIVTAAGLTMDQTVTLEIAVK